MNTEELKRRVATEIMKWQPVRDMAHGRHYWATSGEDQGWVCWEGNLPDWSGDLRSAFDLARRLGTRGLNLSLVTFAATQHAEAMFLDEDEIATGLRQWGRADGDHAMEQAICLAALLAWKRKGL